MVQDLFANPPLWLQPNLKWEGKVGWWWEGWTQQKSNKRSMAGTITGEEKKKEGQRKA